jgi:hypothetical protein
MHNYGLKHYSDGKHSLKQNQILVHTVEPYSVVTTFGGEGLGILFTGLRITWKGP